jgi:serine protease Do
MRIPSWQAAVTAALVLVCGAGTEANAQYNRRTPIVEAVKKTRPGIVAIKVIKQTAGGGSKESIGTGVVVDAEHGYVITNGHVVGETKRVEIRLQDGTTTGGTVIAKEPSCDLAFLQVPPSYKLKALPLGPGSDLMEGETVFAIGHPYGYEFTVSTGIISALGREIEMGDVRLTNLIQTTTSINPGNSGGPLLNINGEVIGINVALRQGAQGIAFALNIDTVKQALTRHLGAHQVTHGLRCKEQVLGEDGPERQHVVVEDVARRTPAAVAGFQVGDQIVRVAGRPITNNFDVERALFDSRPGQQVKLTVKRGGQELTMDLVLSRGTGAEHVATAKPARTGDAAGRVQATGSGYSR